MWSVIKNFIGKRFGGIIAGLVANWRIYLFVVVVVGGYLGTLKYKNYKVNKKLTSANQQIDLLNVNIELIKSSNQSYIFALNQLKKANADCVLNNQVNAVNASNALDELEQFNNEIKKKYNALSKKQVDSMCGNTVIDVELQH